MARAGIVEVDIVANASRFVQEMRGVNRSMQRVERRMQAFARLAGSAFAFLAGGGIARDILNTANAIDDFARRLDISGESLQAWQLAAERFGIGANQLNLAIQRVTRRSAEAALGFGEAQDALRALRIDAQAFSSATLDDQVLTLAQAFEEVDDRARRAQLAFKLFDSEGVAFLQLLSEGEEGLRKLREELQGQVWSDEERERMANANKQLTTLRQNIQLLTGDMASLALETGNWLGQFAGAAQTFLGDLLSGDFQAALRFGRGPLSSGPFSRGEGTPVDQAGAPTTPSALRGIAEPAPGTVGPFDLGPGGATTTTGAGGTDVFGERLQTATEFYNQWLDEQQRLYASAQDQITELNRSAVMARMEDEERFVSMFTTNMVQAADSGFSSILDSWKRTLLQMFLETINSQLFNALGGTGFGSAIFGALGIGGGASGITAAVTDAQRRGTL